MSRQASDDGALRAASDLLVRQVGLRLDPSIRGRLERSVAEEAAAHALDMAVYVERLRVEADLMQKLLDRLTVQETAFFRDPSQFAALVAHVAPQLPRSVTVWSAGCSNGQEPYSLAMSLSDAGLTDWRITATDVSSRALERTRRATYTSTELRGVDASHRARYFVPVGDRWQITDQLRKHVRVLHHNLVSDPPPFEPQTCDVVFCRNVLIYVRREDVIAFLNRLASWLHPKAWLFLGYSESLWHVTDRFQLVRLGDAFVYRLRDAAVGSDGAVPRRLTTSRERSPAGNRSGRQSLRPRREPPHPRRRSEITVEAPAVGDSVAALKSTGEAAMANGDYTAAVTAFRKCTYLEPDEPVAHVHLGLALEGAGDPAAARRAFTAAQNALDRRGPAALEAMLEGYRPDELSRLLKLKLSGTG